MFTIDAYIRAKEVGGRYVGEAGSANTLKTYATCLNQAERMLDKPIAAFTSRDADTLMEIMQEEDYANDSKALILSALRGAFTWAIGNGLYSNAHPFDGIKNPPKRRKLPTILSKEEVERFFKHLENNPKYRLFFKLMYYGGLRIGEVLKLQKADLMEGGILVRGKGDRQRIANLPASLCAELASFIEEHPHTKHVFYTATKKGTGKGPISAIYPYRVFHETKRSAQLPLELHPHNLRHTSATHFYAATNDIALTQKLLGHARVETTLLYAQITNDQLSNAHKAVFGD